MIRKVQKKQNNSRHCLVCGLQNEAGLHAVFYELEGDVLACAVTVGSVHQSYPGRVHGGITSALLDETIGRAVNITEPDTWGVTVELNVRFKKPVPYDVPLIVTGVITENNRRVFSGEGVILLPDQTVAATATARYMKMKLQSITDFEAAGETWETHLSDEDPAELDIPE